MEPVELAEGLYRVAVPLPDNPLRQLNSYFILGEEKTTIVDVGFNHPACAAALDEALTALGRSWESVEVVLTHSHPDHSGALDTIWRRGMRVYANLHSFEEVNQLMELQATVYDPLLARLADTTPAGGSGRIDAQGRYHVSAELLPLKNQPDVFYLADGDVYKCGKHRFSVIETPGHDDWHICLFEPDEKLLIAGDHVLGRITPTIISWMRAHDALREFLDSLDKVRDLDVDLVLPGHGEPFSGLAERVDFLKGHHAARLEELEDLVAAGHDDIIDIASHATWKHGNWQDWELDQKYFSLGETFAHLVYLVCEGRLSLTVCRSDYRFNPAKSH